MITRILILTVSSYHACDHGEAVQNGEKKNTLYFVDHDGPQALLVARIGIRKNEEHFRRCSRLLHTCMTIPHDEAQHASIISIHGAIQKCRPQGPRIEWKKTGPDTDATIHIMHVLIPHGHISSGPRTPHGIRYLPPELPYLLGAH